MCNFYCPPTGRQRPPGYGGYWRLQWLLYIGLTHVLPNQETPKHREWFLLTVGLCLGAQDHPRGGACREFRVTSAVLASKPCPRYPAPSDSLGPTSTGGGIWEIADLSQATPAVAQGPCFQGQAPRRELQQQPLYRATSLIRNSPPP